MSGEEVLARFSSSRFLRSAGPSIDEPKIRAWTSQTAVSGLNFWWCCDIFTRAGESRLELVAVPLYGAIAVQCSPMRSACLFIGALCGVEAFAPRHASLRARAHRLEGRLSGSTPASRAWRSRAPSAAPSDEGALGRVHSIPDARRRDAGVRHSRRDPRDGRRRHHVRIVKWRGIWRCAGAPHRALARPPRRFAYPGGASLEIHQSLSKSTKIRNILCRHEQGEIFAAEGYANRPPRSASRSRRRARARPT